MLYATMTFWLVVLIFGAWGTHRLWVGLVPSKVINLLLLPGTFVAQAGRVLGLLATGGTIHNTALVGDDASGEPKAPADPQTRIPILGPVVVALLPMLACAAAIYFVATWLGRDLLLGLGTEQLTESLPTTIAGFWQLLRDMLTLAETVGAHWATSDFGTWQTWAFCYLVICFTVRMAPLEGNLRGAMGAIVLLGLLAGLLGSFIPAGHQAILSGWPVMSFAVATLILLLVLSLLVRGTVGLVRVIISGA